MTLYLAFPNGSFKGLSNKPKNTQIGHDLDNIFTQHCYMQLGHILSKSCPIWLFLGLFKSPSKILLAIAIYIVSPYMWHWQIALQGLGLYVTLLMPYIGYDPISSISQWHFQRAFKQA